MKTFFVGIDISKDWLDVCICEGGSMQILTDFKSDNSIDGIEKLIGKCRKKAGKDKLWVCFEHTGNYGLLLMHLLEDAMIVYSAVPALEIKRSIGMTRGKNDKVDATRIALYAATNQFKLTETKLPGKDILKIKHLLTFRNQLLKISQQLQNSKKSYLVASKKIDLKRITDDLDVKIIGYKEDIAALDKEIKDGIKANEELNNTYKKITSVKGIGLVIAATMIVNTNNFTAFDNPRKYNCYAGLAPFDHSSGSSIRGKTKTSPLRNRTMKALLFNGANSAVQHDFEMKAYYKRKTSEGKHHNLIINAVACKLVYRIFAVLKRDEPYVNLMR